MPRPKANAKPATKDDAKKADPRTTPRLRRDAFRERRLPVDGGIWGMAFSPDGRMLAFGCRDSPVRCAEGHPTAR